VIQTLLAFDFHANSTFEAKEFVTSSILLMSDKSNMLMLLIASKTSLINFFSSSLFFAMENLNKLIYSSSMVIVTDRRAWLDESQRSG